MHWELWVSAAKASDEVIFEGPNGSFSGIAAMDIGWGKLIVNTLGLHELLKGCGGFIVQTLELGAEAGGAEVCVQNLVGCHNGLGPTVVEGVGQNDVAVVIVKHHDVVIASTGGDREPPSLIGVNEGLGFHNGSKTGMDFGTIGGSLGCCIGNRIIADG